MFPTLLRFQPIFRRYIWGGRRLGTVLGKAIGPESDYAESWEIVDHGADQSVVLEGPLAGKTLGELTREFGIELLGRHAPRDRFPLLFKYLDCNKDLSLQVHPNDQQGAQLVPPDLGKTEAWYILDAVPGSAAYAGLKRGFDRAAVEREIARRTLPLCLHKTTPQAGDCLFIPAGAVHALAAGFLVAEIQQASDTTYRLYDWDRVGPDGQPRPLHIEQGLAVTDFSIGPIDPQPPRETPQGEIMAECDRFTLVRGGRAGSGTIGGDDRFHIVSVIAGELQLGETVLSLGQTALVPAASRVEWKSSSHGLFLEMYLP